MASLKDVANRAGVSVATASRVATGSTYVRPETRDRLGNGKPELDWDLRELEAPGLYLGQVQDVVDEPYEVRAAVADVIDPLSGDRDGVGITRIGNHQVTEPDDRVERRPELVAHAREEVALRSACGTERVHGDRQLLAEPLLRGQGFTALHKVR